MDYKLAGNVGAILLVVGLFVLDGDEWALSRGASRFAGYGGRGVERVN
jgi:hypothetical protein